MRAPPISRFIHRSATKRAADKSCSSSSLVLRANPSSAPCRLVSMTLEVLGLPHQYKYMDFMKGDHLQPRYLKMNPQHTVPLLTDGELRLSESRAIATYLVNRYGGPDHHLYPRDPATRAAVDQRLYFDIGVLYARFSQVIYPQFAETFGPPLPPERIQYYSGRLAKLEEALGWADDFVSRSETGYVASTQKMSLADLAFAATCSTVAAVGLLDFGGGGGGHASLAAWLRRMEREVPNYEELCGEGARQFAGFFHATRLN